MDIFFPVFETENRVGKFIVDLTNFWGRRYYFFKIFINFLFWFSLFGGPFNPLILVIFLAVQLNLVELYLVRPLIWGEIKEELSRSSIQELQEYMRELTENAMNMKESRPKRGIFVFRAELSKIIQAKIAN